MPTRTRCTCISSWIHTDSSEASYQPVKYSAHGDTTYSRNARGGKDSTLATRECSSRSSSRRGDPGSVRSASVTGAPSASASGTTIDSTMCCTMWTLSSVVSYAARPDEVAT